MKRFNLLGVCMMLLFVFVCTTGCKKDEPTTLTVSPNSLELLSDKGSTVSFMISTNTDWTISGLPEWLSLSAMSGTSTGNIIVTALSANASSQERQAELTIYAGDKSSIVSIRQRASLIPNCKVGFKDILAMSTSVAFKYDIDRNVSYFYSGYLSSSAAGWTDEKIINALMDEDRFDPSSSEDTGLQGFAGMDANSEYYLCAVGFNEKGEQGELTKTKIKTLKYSNQDPTINIFDVKYDSSTWYWSTEPDSYTSKYYMIFTDGDYATFYAYYLTEAEVCWLIKDGIDKGNISPIARGGDWNGSRSNGANSVYIATWGVNTDNAFSSVLNDFYGSVNSNKAPQNKIKRTITRSKHSDSLIKEIQEATIVIAE